MLIKRVSNYFKNELILKILFLFFGCLPVVLSFTTLISKDIFFAGSFIILNCFLYDYLFEKNTNTLYLCVGITAFSALSMLFRKNILYVIIIYLFFTLGISIFKHLRKELTIVMSLLLSIIVFNFVDVSLSKMYNANTDGLRRESLSLPFQQTARYVKYYEDEMT